MNSNPIHRHIDRIMRRFPTSLLIAMAASLIVPFLLTARPAGAAVMTTAGPTISAPQGGHPTGTYSIRGTGFGAGDSVTVRFDSTSVRTVPTTSTGSFATTFQVPATALPGSHALTASATPSGGSASAGFIVRTNWPQYKFSDSHRGVNPFENVLSPGNVAGLKVAWATDTGASIGVSSPVVFDGRVYIANSAGTVLALRESDGAIVWTAQTGVEVRSAPTIYHGHVYVSGDGATFAFRLRDGKLLWEAAAGNGTASPTPENGIVYVGGGPLVALNADTGATIWSFSAEDEFHGSPTVENGLVTAGSIDFHTYALNARTGALVWRVRPTDGVQPSDEVFGSTAEANGRVFAGELIGRLFGLAENTGATLWVGHTGGGITFSSPTVANGRVIVGASDGSLDAFNARTGAHLWTAPTTPDANLSSAAAVANGVVYVGSADGSVYAFNLTKGTRLWSAATGGPILSSPAVTDGTVFIGSDDGKVYAYRLG